MHCIYATNNVAQDLLEATSNFSESSKLGQGAYGCVYKGSMKDGQSFCGWVWVVWCILCLPSGTDVAIKVLQVPKEAGFEDEVRVLSKFRSALASAWKEHFRLPRRLGTQTSLF